MAGTVFKTQNSVQPAFGWQMKLERAHEKVANAPADGLWPKPKLVAASVSWGGAKQFPGGGIIPWRNLHPHIANGDEVPRHGLHQILVRQERFNPRSEER